jgi:hypothetical protein
VDELFRFLVKFELPFYALLAIFAVFAIRAAWLAWREWRNSVFGLEKEISFRKLRLSGSLIILLLMIGLSQFCLVTFVVPFLPAATFLLTPTADLLQTPLPALKAGTLSAGTGTPAPPPGTTGCLPGQMIITSPAPGQEIGGNIMLVGTVNMPNFGFYKYEYASQGSEQWATIAAGDKIKKNEDLGGWNTAVLTPGDYQIRLVVVDNLGATLPPCIVPVRVIAPTPIP